MGTAIAVTPGAAFTSATATLLFSSADRAGYVTFTTSTTIPSSPYLIFTLTFATSWTSTYADAPVISVFPCAMPGNSRTAAQMLAVAALGPFCVIPNANFTTAAVYCTNAPSESTAYDLGYYAVQGP